MCSMISLNTGASMPLLGLGLYKATADGEAENAIRSAALMGYRLFDTASAYKNEENVGRGIMSCGIPREQLFVTTKIWNNAQRIGNIEGALVRLCIRCVQHDAGCGIYEVTLQYLADEGE